MTAEIIRLRVHDQVIVDDDVLGTLYRNLGSATADALVARALGELALTMSGLTDRVQAQGLSDIAQALRDLQRMARHLGLTSLAAVASDARLCLDAGDGTAFAAVWARLLRLAERTLVPSLAQGGAV
jgi:hypothetical protein